MAHGVLSVHALEVGVHQRAVRGHLSPETLQPGPQLQQDKVIYNTPYMVCDFEGLSGHKKMSSLVTCVEFVCWRWLARLSCAQLCCTATRLEFSRPGRGPVLRNKGLARRASTMAEQHYCILERKKERKKSVVIPQIKRC